MTKVLMLINLTTLTIMLLTSCGGSYETNLPQEISEEFETDKVDTLFFTPEKTGVTDLVIDFTPRPSCDNGAAFIQVYFQLGVKYEGKIYHHQYYEGAYFREPITQKEAERQMRIADVISAHTYLKLTPEEELKITVVKKKIVKITRMPIFKEDGTFIPSVLILVKE